MPYNEIRGIYECDYCGLDSEDTSVVARGNWRVPGGWEFPQWCPNCVDYHGFTCDTCYESTEIFADESSLVVHRDENHPYEDNDDDDGDECGQLRDYSYKPSPVFGMVTGGGAVYSTHSPRGIGVFGFELETEGGGSNVVRALNDAGGYCLDRFYAKYDGSLSSSGAEIVSHPATLEYWQNAAGDLSAMFDDVRDVGARAWGRSSCGLHVHVSRAAFTGTSRETVYSSAHVARFALLFERNANEVQRVARRSSNYARFSPYGVVVQKVTTPYAGEHFDAINLTPPETVEVRVFRPSLNVGRVLASIELVDAALEYTRNLTAYECGRDGLSWSRFALWCESDERLERYPHLGDLLHCRRFDLRGGSSSARYTSSISEEV